MLALSTAQPLLFTAVPQAFADTYGAKNLDGTPPGYFILKGDPQKWIIFAEGGGWCQSVADCAGRAGTSGGSTGFAPGSPMDVGGLMSPNATINPDFHTWSFVFLHYSDGTSHSSAAVDPIPLPPHLQSVSNVTGKAITQIWMRGRASLKALIFHLLTAQGMSAASDIIFSGGSAGGVTSYFAADLVRAVVHQPPLP